MRFAYRMLAILVLIVTLMLPGCGWTKDLRVKDEVSDASGRPTWVVLGDSLTEDEPEGRTRRYYEFVAADLDCAVVNCGEGGTGYKSPGWSEPFCVRVESIDLSEADCITIFGSFNDVGKGYALGTAEDETADTIGGCMNLTIQRLRSKAPEVRIGIVTPTPWRTNFAFDADQHGSYTATTREECDQYVELLKAVARKYRLPILDLYETCGFDPDDERTRELLYTENGMTDDNGVHPSSKGHEFMYPAWREFVRTLLPAQASEG